MKIKNCAVILRVNVLTHHNVQFARWCGNRSMTPFDDEFTTGDIDHILELLYNRGEIYPVNDRFRFTDPAEFDRRYHDDEA